MKVQQPFLIRGGTKEKMRKRGTNEITTIFWDADNTLLDFQYSMRYSLRECFRSAGLLISEEIIELYDRINNSYWKRLERGEVTKKELLTGRFRELFAELGITGVDVEDFRSDYEDHLGSVYSYLDDSLTICKALQTQVKQYIVTNGVTHTQMKKLKLSGLAEVMDGIFISEQVGCPKPERAFFDHCLSCIAEKDRGKVLIVGDSLTSDIDGGNRAGIRTCWYNPKDERADDKYRIDYEISDLHQIYDILEFFG